MLKKVAALYPNGTTALGPAVLASAAMASKGAAGSQVIVLTDGMANVGIGQFDHYGGRGFGEDATIVYDRIGQFAEQSGVMMNLVTIAGCDSNIEGLSRLVELSGG